MICRCSLGPRAIPTSPSPLVLLVVAALLATLMSARARGAEAALCERHAVDAAARAQVVTGAGEPITVIGDSWTVGLGLSDLSGSWPSQLPGRVTVAGFSGSGFARHASHCGDRAFATRVGAARGADLVVVAGGLNDFDQPTADIRAGFRSLIASLAGRTVVIVGPASAPSRARAVAASTPRWPRCARSTASPTSTPAAGRSPTSPTACTSPPPDT